MGNDDSEMTVVEASSLHRFKCQMWFLKTAPKKHSLCPSPRLRAEKSCVRGASGTRCSRPPCASVPVAAPGWILALKWRSLSREFELVGIVLEPWCRLSENGNGVESNTWSWFPRLRSEDLRFGKAAELLLPLIGYAPVLGDPPAGMES